MPGVAAKTKPKVAEEKPKVTEEMKVEVPAIGQSTITTTSLQPAEHFRSHYCAAVGPKATPNDILRPAFWTHVASKLRRMDKIEVIPEHEGWYAELLVVSTGIGFAKVAMIRFLEIEVDEEQDADLSTTVEWGGVEHKYRIIRKADRYAIASGFESKASAMQAQSVHERALAA